MKKSGIQRITMVLGVFTALVIVFSQFFIFQGAGNTKKLAKTENHEKQKAGAKEKACISLPSFSQSISAHAEVNQKSSLFLFDILFGDINDEDDTIEIPVSSGKLFQTLFTVFISPNAP